MKRLILIIYGILCSILCRSQELDRPENYNPYYLEINGHTNFEVFPIYEGILSLKYEDKIGKSSVVELVIRDWENSVTGTFTLQKKYGINHFNINLTSLALVEHNTYRCILQDELENKHIIYIKPVAKIETAPPAIHIITNPISVSCNDPLGNVVEFYGKIKEGRAPYTITWYVMNETRTNFLYQPREEIISKTGFTPAIKIDQAPDYYVMLHVKDDCGGVAKQMVHLICKENDNTINTVFIEPIQILENNSGNK